MRNPLRLFGLFRSSDRRRSPGGRAYPSMDPAPRRYELPRADPVRTSMPPPRRTQRNDHREVNWRRRGMIAMTSLGVIGIYLSKIFSEVKQRPFTIIRRIYE